MSSKGTRYIIRFLDFSFLWRALGKRHKNSLPLYNFWTTEDFWFIFGGVMYPGAKVSRRRIDRIYQLSTSPPSWPWAQNSKRKNCDYTFNYAWNFIKLLSSPQLIRVHNIPYNFLVCNDFWFDHISVAMMMMMMMTVILTWFPVVCQHSDISSLFTHFEDLYHQLCMISTCIPGNTGPLMLCLFCQWFQHVFRATRDL
jgi:hypothetical protein